MLSLASGCNIRVPSTRLAYRCIMTGITWGLCSGYTVSIYIYSRLTVDPNTSVYFKPHIISWTWILPSLISRLSTMGTVKSLIWLGEQPCFSMCFGYLYRINLWWSLKGHLEFPPLLFYTSAYEWLKHPSLVSSKFTTSNRESTGEIS